MMRLRMAADIVVSIGVVLAVEYLFVRTTGALQTPAPAGAAKAAVTQIQTVNHALMVIAMMLGAILAMISGFGASMMPTARAQLGTLLFLPLPLLATLAMGLAQHVRVLSLASLVVILAIGTWCRRFGPRGFNGGVLAFMGAFLGFFIQDFVPLAGYGWLAAEIALGAATTIVVHFAFFRPRPGTAVARMQRSYAARAREVASDLTELYQATVRAGHELPRADPRLQRQLLRLNEAALLIDARLDDPAAVPPGWSAATLHQRLFDAEVGLSNVARFALAIARRGLPAPVTTAVGQALASVQAGDFAAAADAATGIEAQLDRADGGPGADQFGTTDRILLHRFATTVTEFAAAIDKFGQYPARRTPDDEATPAADAATSAEPFQTQVALFGGWLPGSSAIAGVASAERGAITAALDPPADDRPTPGYVRSASRFAHIADTLPSGSPSRTWLALRDLQLLDGALAQAAQRAGIQVTDLDTTRPTAARPAEVPVSC